MTLRVDPVEVADSLLAMDANERGRVVRQFLESDLVAGECWMNDHVGHVERLMRERRAVLDACREVYHEADRMSATSSLAVSTVARRVAGLLGSAVL